MLALTIDPSIAQRESIDRTNSSLAHNITTLIGYSHEGRVVQRICAILMTVKQEITLYCTDVHRYG